MSSGEAGSMTVNSRDLSPASKYERVVARWPQRHRRRKNEFGSGSRVIAETSERRNDSGGVIPKPGGMRWRVGLRPDRFSVSGGLRDW